MIQEASQPSINALNLISIGLLTPGGKELNAGEMYLIIDGGNFLRDLMKETKSA